LSGGEAHREAPLDQWTPVELTRRLLAFDTINPPGREADCIAFIAGLLEPLGFRCQTHAFAEGRPSLVAVLPGRREKQPLCIAGHVDTVPLGTRPWSYDAFAGEIDGGRLYGRGSSDMKSGIAAFLIACGKAARGPRLAADLVIVAASGEETGCEGSYFLASLPDVLGKAGALVIAEPSGNYPMVGHKGALWLTAEAAGVSAHGAMPELGVNAIYKAARAISALEDFGFNVAPHGVLGSPSLSVGTVQGGTAVNAVPDHAAFTIDIRTLPAQANDAVQAAIQSYLGTELAIRPLISTGGVFSDPRHPWIQAVFDIAVGYLGERPETRTLPFFTDASALTPALGDPPTVILGPGETQMAHQTDEYCEVAKLEAAVDFYGDIIAGWNALELY
jgi:succinyl-diaminopimelate desuccinylase